MSFKEVKRTAALAWSPPQHTSPMLATGTLAGAMDASFSTSAELEIHDLKMEDKSSLETTVKTTLSVPSRFNRLAWSSFNAQSNDGVLIGGCEDGSINFWNVSELLKAPSNESALIRRVESHKGPVRGLQVNPFQPFMVASGSTDAEVCLWDLNNPSQPYAPSANKSSRLEDITDLAWNRQVGHILATSSNSGNTVVWDLKARKEVLTLSSPGQRISMSAIAWNPDLATQILVASDDDAHPVIYSWDLRNARAPEKILTGHTKGILSLAWCPKDAELLLSCGKDNRSICWNPKTGSIVSELTSSDNWLFDVQWSPRNPDLFCTASFSGVIEVNSFQALISGGGRPAPVSATGDDFFSMAASSAAAPQRTIAPAHLQIPKWLRRPIGVAFGFGGRMISFSGIRPESARVVSIVTVVVPATQKLVQESLLLDSTLKTETFADFCAVKIPSPVPNLHAPDQESVFWNVAKVLFEANPQEKLMNLLGFDHAQLNEKMRKLSVAESQRTSLSKMPSAQRMAAAAAAVSPAHPVNTIAASPTADDFFAQSPPGAGGDVDFAQLVGQNGGFGEENDFDAQAQPQAPPQSQQQAVASPAVNGIHVKPQSTSPFSEKYFSLFGPDSNEVDKTITKAIILGNFDAAVDLCVNADRLSDALLVAICGGEQLVARTQQLYFQKSQYPYLRLVSAIVKKDLTDVVENAFIENWEEILALICSYAKDQMFNHLCNVLGDRIEAALNDNPKLLTPALICFMAAGNAARAARLVLRQGKSHAPPTLDLVEYGLWLEGIIEKTRILEGVSRMLAPQDSLPIQEVVPEISDKYLEYSYIMANNGLLEIAARYYNSSSPSRPLDGEGDQVAVFAAQLAKATTSLNVSWRPVPDPFQVPVVDVQQEAPKYVAPVPEPSQPQYQAQPAYQQQQPMMQPMASQGQQPWMQPQQSQQASHQAPPFGAQPPRPQMPPLPGMPPMPAGGMMGGSPPMAPRPPVMGPPLHGMPPMPGMPPQSHSSSGIFPASPLASVAPPTMSRPPFGAAPTQPPIPQPVAPPMQPPSGSGISPSIPQPPLPGMGFSNQAPQAPPQQMASQPPMPVPMPMGTQAPRPQVPAPPAVTSPGRPPMQMPSMVPPPPAPAAPFQAQPLPPQSASSFGVPPTSSPFGQAPPQPQHSPFGGVPPTVSPSTLAPPVPSAAPQHQQQPPQPQGMLNVIPAPPMPTSTPPPQEMSARRTAAGAYNDPPIVAPRIPATSMNMAAPAPPTLAPVPMTAPTMPSIGSRPPMAPISQTSPKDAPVDPSRIPAHLQPIYQIFSKLIHDCQERAMPMQRRIVDDSAKRMGALFTQLMTPELSQPVIDILLEMCNRLRAGQYDRAHELHTPLMTNYFAECGAWILAAKRLIEVAKVTLQ